MKTTFHWFGTFFPCLAKHQSSLVHVMIKPLEWAPERGVHVKSTLIIVRNKQASNMTGEEDVYPI